MILVADPAGPFQKNARKSDNATGRGNILARDEWSTYKTIVFRSSIILMFFEITFVSWVIYQFAAAYDPDFVGMGYKLLFGLIILWIILHPIIWIFGFSRGTPLYRFTVYDSGFVYEKKLPRTDFRSNYMPYGDIRAIYFKKYGMRMILALDANRQATIDIGDDYKAYITLMMKLKTLFDFNAFPDIQAIIDYKEAQNREASPESFHNEGMCRRELETKNIQFA